MSQGTGADAASPEEVYDVVVLASGVNTIPLYEGFTPGYKSLIPYRGRASVEYVLDALCAAEGVGRITVEGPSEALREVIGDRVAASGGRLEIIDGGATFLESLEIGLRRHHHQRGGRDPARGGAARRVLFATGDLPLLRARAVEQFLAGCREERRALPYDPSVYVSVAPRSSYAGPYARFTKPFNRFRDGAVCHGNLFLLAPDLLDNADLRERVNRMYAHRKTVRSMLALGWRVMLAYVVGVELLHLLTLRQMAAYASRRLGVGIAPVVVPDPDVTMDVDEADDYEFVRDRLDERAALRAGGAGGVPGGGEGGRVAACES